MNGGGFFPLLGEVAASFAGLLFVALAINLAKLTSDDGKHLMLLARQTFFTFLFMAGTSLVAVSKFGDAKTFSIFLFADCLAGIGMCALAIREHERAVSQNLTTRKLYRSYYLPAAMYVLLAFSAARAVLQHTDQLTSIEVEMIVLLVVSARNAWVFLMP